jgi:hypothetical protein
MKAWPQLPALPGPNVALMDAAGHMNKDWYRYFVAADIVLRGVTLLSLNDLADIDADAPADGDVLTFEDTNATWGPA